ncbi:MAG: alpha/beta hydrolase fold domain-containing protein [Pirellulaceae bacterium]|nr:alpha/beta hydrolase fold domain-containing protein [Pirellulaceae bacterium]
MKPQPILACDIMDRAKIPSINRIVFKLCSAMLVLMASVSVDAQDKTVTIDERLQQLFKKFPEADANGDGVLTDREARAYKQKSAKKTDADDSTKSRDVKLLKPTHTDVAYGPHERNILDFWQASSNHPTPVLIFFHGGSFKGGDKAMLQDRSILKECIEAGISAVSVNYRFSTDAAFPAPMHDGARAVQFVRSKAKEWNVDSDLIAVSGSSAGATLALWIALHDDLADTKSEDPIARFSTRVKCASPHSGTAGLEPEYFQTHAGVTKLGAALWQLFGASSQIEFASPAKRPLLREASPLLHATSDDPPLFLTYAGNPAEAPFAADSVQRAWIHHVSLGLPLKAKYDSLGCECTIHHQANPAKKDAEIEFLKKHLLSQRRVELEPVTYKHNTDRDLLMTITKPSGWSKSDYRPAIIFFYNGGWKEPGATKPQFEEQARYFAARGMLVGQADYHEKSKDGPTSAKCVEDIFSGIRWLRSHAVELGIDPNRVTAVGGSGSIHLPAAALHVAELQSADEDTSIDPLPRAMFLFNPDPDVLDASMMRKLTESHATNPKSNPPPMVVYYGSRDAVASSLDTFVEQAKQAGLPIENFIGAGGVHGFFKFSPGLEQTVKHMDDRLCQMGLLDREPTADLPHKIAPADYEDRILETQQRWLERHHEIASSRQPKSTPKQDLGNLEKQSEVAPQLPPSFTANDSSSNTLPPTSHIYQVFGERKLQIAMHYPADWKSTDQRTAILFFSGSHKVQANKEGELPPLAAERERLGLTVVNQGPGGEQHVSICDAIAKQGYVCMRVEYRTRGKDGVLPGVDIADAVSAIRWVRGHTASLGVASDRIVAAGGSSGGYLAASLFAFESRFPTAGDPSISARPNAILLYSPLIDWLEVGSMSENFLVVLNGDRELGARISPARHWKQDCPPTLVMVGSEEPPFKTVEAFAEKWKAAGAPMELFVAEGGEHGFFGKPAWLDKTIVRTEAFLRENHLSASEASAKTSSNTPPGDKQVYKTIGERKLSLSLHFPSDWKFADKRPAIVFWGGGGFNPTKGDTLGIEVANAGPGQAFKEEAEHFAKLGLVSIRVEYRKRKIDNVLPDKAVEDAKSAMRWVRSNAERLGIDPNRIVACGGSSGGHLAASVATLAEFDSADDDLRFSAKPNAMMLHFPLLDFLEGGTRSMPFLDALDGDRDLGERLSPARHWNKDLPPTLVLIGTQDPMYEYLKSFAEKWQATGSNLTLFVGEGGGHGFSTTPAWRERSMACMEDFLRKVGCFESNPTTKTKATADETAVDLETPSIKERLETMLKKTPEADVNRDGVLTMEEAMAFKMQSRKPKAAPSQEAIPTEIQSVEKNPASSHGLLPSRDWDTNKDGKISKEEFKAPAKLFENMDVDSDGFLADKELNKLDSQLNLDKTGDTTWVVPPESDYHGVSHHTYVSESMKTKVGYNIYLPDDYATSEKRYPVIYHLHGSGGNESVQIDQSVVYHKAIQQKKLTPVIIVFVNGGRRSYYSDSADGKILSETTIIKELIPYIDSTYRTIPEKACRVLHGFSMGGFGTVKLGMKYPDLFCAALSFSGGMASPDSVHMEFLKHILGNNESSLKENNPADIAIANKDLLKDQTIWLFAGSRDVWLEDSQWAHEFLESHGIVHRFEISKDTGHALKRHFEFFGDEIYRMLGKHFATSKSFQSQSRGE